MVRRRPERLRPCVPRCAGRRRPGGFDAMRLHPPCGPEQSFHATANGQEPHTGGLLIAGLLVRVQSGERKPTGQRMFPVTWQLERPQLCANSCAISRHAIRRSEASRQASARRPRPAVERIAHSAAGPSGPSCVPICVPPAHGQSPRVCLRGTTSLCSQCVDISAPCRNSCLAMRRACPRRG